MKKLVFLLIFALSCGQLFAQHGNWLFPPCTPDGSTFSDSFGDGGVLCWATGPVACNHTWTVTGSAVNFAIAVTPNTPPLYTACTNSLKATIPAASNQFITTTGTFATIPAGAAVDFVFTIDVASQAMASFDLTNLFVPSSDANAATTPGKILFRFDGTNLQLQGNGSTASGNINITLNTWHTVKFHLAAGAAASFIQVDGGTAQTFTENATAATYISFGSSGGNLDALTYSIGNVLINAVGSPNCVIPQVFTDMEAGSNGTTITPALMNSSTHGGNGTWTGNASPITGMSFQSAASMGPTIVPFDVCGTYFQDLPSTLGLQYDVSQAVHNFPIYTPTTVGNTTWSMGFWFSTNLDPTDAGFYTIAFIVNGAGTDRAGPEIHGDTTQLILHLESGACAGACGTIPILPNTKYWLTTQYQAGGTHTLRAFDVNGKELIGSPITSAALNANPPNAYEIGRIGSETGNPAGKTWNYDDILFDYVTGTFPLGPSYTN